jgi:hypothetical protein
MSALVLALVLALDGGLPPPPAQVDADREVIEHLELLEGLDDATDLELLEALTLER